MPNKPPRRQRRGQPRPQPRPPIPAAQPTVAGPGVVAATPVATMTAPSPAAATTDESTAAAERSITRFTARDYTYVKRELTRIAIIASAIFILIIVLAIVL